MLCTTPNLLLYIATLPMLDAIVAEDWPVLSKELGGVEMAENWMHFPEAMVWMRNYLQENPGELGWWSALAVHKTDFKLIGTGGYKGMPTPDGTVEIGYEIASAYQGRGLATELARGLVDKAFRQEQVQAVIAHTLAEENASVTVLQKLGFSLAGETYEEEDGHIWQWQLEKI